VSDFDEDAAALAQVADELVAHQRVHGNLVIELPPIAGLQLATLLQLLPLTALTPAAGTLVGSLLVLVRAYFAACPSVLAVLDAGDAVDPDARRVPFSTNTRH